MLGKILLLVSILALNSCVAMGDRYEGSVSFGSDTSTIYLLRESHAVGSILCLDMYIDDTKIGCIKNGGFMHFSLAPGKHKISSPPIGWSTGASADISVDAGKIYYYEYAMDLKKFRAFPVPFAVIMSGEVDNGFVELPEDAATNVLKDLRDSK